MKIKTDDRLRGGCDNGWNSSTKGIAPVELFFDAEGRNNVSDKLLIEGYHVKMA